MKRDTWQLLNSVNTSIIKIRGAYAAWARAHGINYHETLILYSLAERGACTQKEICSSYLVPKQTINNIITEWKKAGYLCLVPGTKGREKPFKLTESGQAYAESVMGPLRRIEEEAVRLMGEEDLLAMTGLALRYGQILEKVMSGSEGGNGDENHEKSSG